MKTRLTTLMAILALATIPGLLFAQEEAAATGGSTSLIDLILQGGWAMIPLGLVCLFMLYLVFYCYLETQRSKFIPDSLLPQLTENMQWRDVATASQTLQASTTALARTLGPALQKARPDWPDANKEKIEQTLVELLESEDTSIGAWINYLNVCAAVAPMIGLLGTVSGMISAFQTIGEVGMGDPSALAGDIGEALMTTATGLVIGIPAMVFYFIYKNRLAARMVATAQTASNLIDHLAGEYATDEAVYTEEYVEE